MVNNQNTSGENQSVHEIVGKNANGLGVQNEMDCNWEAENKGR